MVNLSAESMQYLANSGLINAQIEHSEFVIPASMAISDATATASETVNILLNKPKVMQTNCDNCGAPLQSFACEYCKTEYR